MRDFFFVGFLGALLALGLKRPFLFVLAYAYVDIVAPQRLSYWLLSGGNIVLYTAVAAMGSWLLLDDKKGLRVSGRQWLMAILIAYAGYTTLHADLPVEAAEKWDWAWKALLFAIFLPFTLRTKLRIESYLLFMVLAASAIVMVGGIKTMLSGGGYGALNLMVDNNSGLYEGSTISAIAVAMIPLILWLVRFGTVFPSDWRAKLFAAGLIFACLLIPVGTEARTGLVCIAVLAILMLRDLKRRMLYVSLIALVGAAALPMLPDSFTSRMGTISGYEADSSATTRLAVWGWTWDYVQKKPMGGGFEAFRLNRIEVSTVTRAGTGPVRTIDSRVHSDEGRAWHSAYFEMLGEQGFPGLFLFLAIHIGGLVRMEVLRRRYRKAEGDKAWIAPLATALQHFQIVYLVGAAFVAIAFQPFPLMILGVQIGFDQVVARRERAERGAAASAAGQKLRPLAVTGT
ncbi:putative O-glycosylation ligase, exosortase A system-associated [Allosphingosinicella sp.]|uniref:putative O-glycosylation ligase, exosortase A system-associated n=1 Tax=Allosphingosinicella sp. TaxID=2823234 RepID=UPI002EDE3DD0